MRLIDQIRGAGVTDAFEEDPISGVRTVVELPAADGVALWQRLTTAGLTTVLGGAQHPDETGDHGWPDESATLLASSHDLDEEIEQCLDRLEAQLGGLDKLPRVDPLLLSEGEIEITDEGTPGIESALRELAEGQPARVRVLDCPTWEVPQRIGFGSFNLCPAPRTHAGVLRQLEQWNGARLVRVYQSTLDVIVDRPARTRPDLAEMMRLVVRYDLDFADDLPQVAWHLSQHLWRFWWD
jgi:hypothetical protein